jgi:hypothetical protein
MNKKLDNLQFIVIYIINTTDFNSQVIVKMNLNKLISRCKQKLLNGRSNLKGLSSMIIKIRLAYIFRAQTPYYLNT